MPQTHSSGPAEGLWLPISEVARIKGVSKQAVAKRVDRLVEQGLISTRAGERGAKLINVAEYDRAAGQTEDAVRTLNGSGAVSASAPGRADGADPVLAREQARRAAYDADLKQLDLEERLGKLITVAAVEDAMTACAETMVRGIEQLPGRADEVAAAVARDGAAGARAALKIIARELRESLARALTLRAGEDEAGEAV